MTVDQLVPSTSSPSTSRAAARARPRPRAARLAAAAVLAALGATLAVPALAPGALPDAHAAARVSVTNEFGNAQADTTYATTVTVSGSGFQSIQGAFGGIYVFFGWVSDPSGGSWAPSRGGVVGANYRYVPDSEQADNQGYQRFVAFPGSETSYAANGGEVSANGSWSTRLVIPGPTFQALDRAGNATTVDCREVQCGIITFGAHGVRNATNETFTPVAFTDLYSGGGQASGSSGGGSGSGTAQESATGDAGTGTGGGASGAETDASSTGEDDDEETAGTTREPGSATLGIDQSTAVVGRAMSFVAQGFEPGEQVVGVVDNGIVGVGPLNAGAHGEVAGLIQLPDDLRVGTHVLRLTGATSGLAPEVEFTATRDPADVAALEAAEAAAAAREDGGGYSAAEIAVAIAGLLLLAVIVSSFATARRRRRAERAAAEAAAEPGTTAERTESDPLTEVLPPVVAPAPAGPAHGFEPVQTGEHGAPATAPVPVGRHA